MMSTFFSVLLPKRCGIPVLMYHKVEHESHDALTVSKANFKAQMTWLKSEGYQSISLQAFLDFIEGKIKRENLPPKPVLITFDDGYRSTLKEAAPVLEQYQFLATLFATSAFIQEAAQGTGSIYLSPDELREWKLAGHDVALHSHQHIHYKNASLLEILTDVKKNQDYFKTINVPAHAVLAYPYGGRPKDSEIRLKLKKSLKEQGILAAFRIGNRVATWSFLENSKLDLYELPRIDIRGEDTLGSFIIKVQKGRIRPFQ